MLERSSRFLYRIVPNSGRHSALLWSIYIFYRRRRRLWSHSPGWSAAARHATPGIQNSRQTSPKRAADCHNSYQIQCLKCADDIIYPSTHLMVFLDLELIFFSWAAPPGLLAQRNSYPWGCAPRCGSPPQAIVPSAPSAPFGMYKLQGRAEARPSASLRY